MNNMRLTVVVVAAPQGTGATTTFMAPVSNAEKKAMFPEQIKAFIFCSMAAE